MAVPQLRWHRCGRAARAPDVEHREPRPQFLPAPTPRVTLPREFETVPRMKWITREPMKVNRVACPPLFRA